jgi:AcrR family transcriptional regulator
MAQTLRKARKAKAPRQATADKPSPIRRRDREKTRSEILRVALEEFAENGLHGANTDVIAARANITKRLIFYYFNSKEELYTAALEASYARMRSAEESLQVDVLEPEAAIRKLAEFSFDFHQAHLDHVRLVTIENIHRGRHIQASKKLREMTRPIVDQIARVLAKAERAGAIRPGIDPRELHMTLSALCFFAAANRHTFEQQFDWDMSSAAAKARRRTEIGDLLWRYVRRD